DLVRTHRGRGAHITILAGQAGRSTRMRAKEKTLRAPSRARLPLLRFRPGGIGLDAVTRRASNSLPGICSSDELLGHERVARVRHAEVRLDVTSRERGIDRLVDGGLPLCRSFQRVVLLLSCRVGDAPGTLAARRRGRAVSGW